MEDRITIIKDMAVIHVDFFRTLPGAFPDLDYNIDGTTVCRQWGGGTLEIKLGPEGFRRIALLKLPQTPVTLTLTGYSDAQRVAPMEQFDRAFRLSGG